MRTGLYVLLAATTACTATPADPAETPAPTSVRERLEDRTRLLLSTERSTGAITAEKKNGTGWDIGTIALPFANGEVELSSDASNALTIEGIQVTFGDIAIPEGVFGGRMAALTNVRIELDEAVRATAAWTSDDEVTLTAELPLTMHWAINIDGGVTELGAPRLPKVPVEIHVSGDADHVEATLAGQAPGELWSWAGVIKLRDLELDLAAELAPPL